VATVARAHWPFVLILAAGLILRVLAEVAYRPALLYIDSAKYLVGSGGSPPEGYQLLLRLLDPLGGLGLVAAAQHAFGLAMATALYALLIRRRVPRWAAMLAAAPVLRDYQLGGGYTPGRLYAIGLVAGLLGALSGLLRKRKLAAADKEQAAACLLVTLSATVLLLSSDAYEFSWRYQLPAVVIVPVAGALGFTALATRVKHARARASHPRHGKPPASRNNPRASQCKPPPASQGQHRTPHCCSDCHRR